MDIKQELDSFKQEYMTLTPDLVVDQTVREFICDFVLPRLEGPRVLELGVGDQIWTPRLVQRFSHVTTVDGSRELLNEMEKTLSAGNWTPVVSLFEEYQPEELFDTILLTYVLEHVDDPLLVVSKARTWLRPGGRLAIVVPHALSLHRRLAVKMSIASYCGQLGDNDRRWGHKHCFTIYEMQKIVVGAGFSIVEQRGMFTKTLPNSMLAQCSREQLRGLCELGLELPVEYSAAIFILAEKKSEMPE